jgi:hypothetical protein
MASKRDQAIINMYEDGLQVNVIEQQFGLKWTGPNSLCSILKAHGVELRRGEHGPQDGGRRPRHRCFRPYTDDELIALYKRVWGRDWQPEMLARFQNREAA